MIKQRVSEIAAEYAFEPVAKLDYKGLVKTKFGLDRIQLIVGKCLDILLGHVDEDWISR